MQILLPIQDKHNNPVYKNIKKINIFFVNKDKTINIYKKTFVDSPYGLYLTINNRMYIIIKKQICWHYISNKFSLRRYGKWEPYVLILDSEAYKNMLP